MTPSPAASDELRRFRAAAYESSRPELRELVPPTARRVLDLGCATGAVGEALARDLGVEVVGIENDPIYAEAAEGRRMGFDGKSLIHPSQIAPCHTAFAPAEDEVARAERLVAAATGGAERFEGEMIERMHVEAAERLLARASRA